MNAELRNAVRQTPEHFPAFMALNDRQRKYVQGIVSGLSQYDAYASAGYKPHRANCWLLYKRPNIQAALNELREHTLRHTKVTAESVVAKLWDEATYRGNHASHGARVQACAVLARILGMYNDRLTVNDQLQSLQSLMDNLGAQDGQDDYTAPGGTGNGTLKH